MNYAGIWKMNLSGSAAYKSFCPAPLPPEIIIDEEMMTLLMQATRTVAELDTLAQYIPSMKLFISMYVRKEALLSSQIEGTQATLEDVLDPLIEKNANLEVDDVINYIRATEYALSRTKELPLCNRLLKEIHAVLMDGVRGYDKNPGEFRRSQNWIGAAGSTLKTARYIPPCVEDMEQAMSDLEKYMHTEDSLSELIRIGLIHYQFETIHPFLDGNGRIGRLLIPLYLIHRGILHAPVLYISYFLKKNRVEYYDRMSEVRNNNNYEQWIKFFLRALSASCEDAVRTVLALSELHDRNIKKIHTMGRASDAAEKVFTYAEQYPILEIGKAAQDLGLAFSTVSAAVRRFVDMGLFAQNNMAKRNRTFSYTDYLNILRKDT